jgi:hypothetical protein
MYCIKIYTKTLIKYIYNYIYLKECSLLYEYYSHMQHKMFLKQN